VKQKPCDIVLQACVKPRRRVLWLAALGALLLHVGGAAAALALNTGSDPKPRKLKTLVVVDHMVDLTPPPPEPKLEAPPPPPPPVKEKPKLKPPPAAKEAPAPEPVAQPAAPPAAPEPEKPPSEPPPAAQAAQVLAAEGAGDPAFKIVTGAGSSYAGGTTTAAGTGTQANHSGQVGSGTGNGYSKARTPQLASRNWSCGWPPEAEELDLEEAFVTVRATINADGSLADVRVLQDPGYGFGKRVVWCARTKVRFEPALDASGNPVKGDTPPLRVRFVRDDEF
jgi:periplasmic protein TonB